jgi:hypothetical protein
MSWRVNNMKVIYQDSVVKRIADAKRESEAIYKTIKSIELTRAEAIELFETSTHKFSVPLRHGAQTIDDVKVSAIDGIVLYGIKMHVESK